jgi:hypothetical protein
MTKKFANRNLELLSLIANRLEELCDEVTFVGGCVLGLLITDQAAPDVRFTVDIDCIVNVITKHAYYALAEKLRKKGFKEFIPGDHPICRWDCDGILLDIMPIEKNVLGFSNKWYEEALKNSISITIKNSKNIHIISAPYFLATKIEAFKDRGQGNFLFSHDIEDIITVLDGRAEIITEINHASNQLKSYLALEFSSFINNANFLQALPGHLNDSSGMENRKNIVLARIDEVIKAGSL